MAPLFSALTARLMKLYGINKVQKQLMNGGIYNALTFKNITSGSNGAYNASTGWNPVCGMGSFSSYNSFKS